MTDSYEGEPTPEQLSEIPTLDQFTLQFATKIIDIEIFDQDAADAAQVEALLEVVSNQEVDPSLREEAIDRVYEIFKRNEQVSEVLGKIIQRLDIDSM